MKKNIVQHNYNITRKERRLSNGHNSFLIFFTGLSGSGKSTIAGALEDKLFQEGINTYALDGDNVRNGVSSDLDFSPKDRSENIRRIGEISKLFVDAGVVVLAAFVSPYIKDRDFIKNTVEPDNYIEIYMNARLEECEKRDVKGLYKMARKGEIQNMTGISAPYEAPSNPDIELSQQCTVDESVDFIFNYIEEKLQMKKRGTII